MVRGRIFALKSIFSIFLIHYLLHIGIKKYMLQHAFCFTYFFVPESKLLLTLFICPTPPHHCLPFHNFTYTTVAVLIVVVAVIVYFPFLTFCSTNRTCLLTTKEQANSKVSAIYFHWCICLFSRKMGKTIM